MFNCLYFVSFAQNFGRQAAWVTETSLGENLFLNFEALSETRLARTNAQARLAVICTGIITGITCLTFYGVRVLDSYLPNLAASHVLM
jgi:hypothetical protein